MDYLGLLTLGAFVGSIAAIGVRYINSVDSWQKVLLAVLPAVLSGVAIAFVDRFKYSPATGCYPLGLICAFLWTYGDVAVQNIAGIPMDPKRSETGGFKGQCATPKQRLSTIACPKPRRMLPVPPTLASSTRRFRPVMRLEMQWLSIGQHGSFAAMHASC